MPNRNGTGPDGQGSKTGRGLGTCGDGTPQKSRRFFGLGRGFGRGLGRGLGFRRNTEIDEQKK